MERKMDDLYNASKIAFASTFGFYLKAHFYHWNVEGSDFKQYHDLFGDIYEEVFESVDVFAEQLRGIGTYVPGSFARFDMLSKVEDELAVVPKEQMVLQLATDNEKMVKILKMAYDIAEAHGEHGFSSFLADRMDAHRKHGWMLRASTKGQ
jgi:starvation-inducible DNA-binding protein